MTEVEILEKLERTEGDAQAILAETAARKADLQKQADERTRAFDAKTDEEAKEKLEGIKADLEKQLEADLAHLGSDTDAETAAFSQRYEKELDARADEIVARIFRVTP